MRVVTPRVLKEYSDRHAQAKIPLLLWYEVTKKASWKTLADIKRDFNSVDYVGNSRFVFNIGGNNFRLIAIIIFASQKVYIRFIGTHAAYDKLKDASTV
ncbi:MAG: type II toxin-antitoxin system HigB family toxin [Bacteroidia bacterium]|nr:type II toxin-antitoxin system HigB family toxin [Bacteroidia bacterium]